MDKITSTHDQIKAKIWSTQLPEYVRNHPDFSQSEMDVFIKDSAFVWLAVQYILNILNDNTVSKEEVLAVVEKAKSKEGLIQIAHTAVMNIKFNPADIDKTSVLTQITPPEK